MGFSDAMRFVMENEGGYSDDKDDAGGETNYGIASKYNGDVDVKKLSRAGAERLYKERYWDPYKADDLPHKIGVKYFDVLVNAGPRDAGLVLQKAINRTWGDKKVGVDGIVGRRTVGAAFDVDEEELIESMVEEQKNMYLDKIKKRPTNLKYRKGWLSRAARVPEISREERET